MILRLILLAIMATAVLSLMYFVGQRYPGFRLGRLPGDIYVERGKTTIVFPFMSMIVFSLLVTIGFNLLRFFKR